MIFRPRHQQRDFDRQPLDDRISANRARRGMAVRRSVREFGANRLNRCRVVQNDRDRGAAAVEFACILPVLLLTLLAAVDLGRFAHTWIAVTNSVRAGASYGYANSYTPASYSNWELGVRESAQGELDQLAGFNANELSVTVTPETDANGRRRFRIHVAYPFRLLVGWPIAPSSVQLQQSGVFPILQ